MCKFKYTFHTATGHDVPGEELKYSSALSLTSALHMAGGQRNAPAKLSPWKAR